MVRALVLLIWGTAWMAAPDRAFCQTERVSLNFSPVSFAPALRPTPQAIAIPDSVRKKVGYQHWKGAAIGGAVGALGGVLLEALAHTECVDCTSNHHHTLKAGAIGAGLVGAFGFLVGAASPKYRWVRTDAEQPETEGR
jgi:hypothetical protein